MRSFAILVNLSPCEKDGCPRGVLSSGSISLHQIAAWLDTLLVLPFPPVFLNAPASFLFPRLQQSWNLGVFVYSQRPSEVHLVPQS